MMITVTTVVSFNPVEEYEQMQRFIMQNEISEWEKHESTSLCTFVHITYNVFTQAGGESDG